MPEVCELAASVASPCPLIFLSCCTPLSHPLTSLSCRPSDLHRKQGLHSPLPPHCLPSCFSSYNAIGSNQVLLALRIICPTPGLSFIRTSCVCTPSTCAIRTSCTSCLPLCPPISNTACRPRNILHALLCTLRCPPGCTSTRASTRFPANLCTASCARHCVPSISCTPSAAHTRLRAGARLLGAAHASCHGHPGHDPARVALPPCPTVCA